MNIVRENENSEIAFPPLAIYKDKYSKILSNYLKEYEDNNEKTFVELQIEHWKNYGNEFLNKEGHTFNKYKIEKLRASRQLITEYLENKLQNLNSKTKELEAKSNTKKDKTKEYWFIVGVKFATGEMQNLLKNYNPTQIANQLGNKNLRPYIGSSNGTEKLRTDKNIFSKKKTDIELILKYCSENNLNVCQDFKDKIKHIITD